MLTWFLDFAKSFDTVDYKKLSNIMPQFGIIKESFKWLKLFE